MYLLSAYYFKENGSLEAANRYTEVLGTSVSESEYLKRISIENLT